MMISVETPRPDGIGIDIAEIDRFRRASRHFLELAFTPNENRRCRASHDPARAYAVAWAAKEAAVKAVEGEWHLVQIETRRRRAFPVPRRNSTAPPCHWRVHWSLGGSDHNQVWVVAKAWRIKEAA